MSNIFYFSIITKINIDYPTVDEMNLLGNFLKTPEKNPGM